MLQVMIKLSDEAGGIVYSLEVYQNSRFVRLLKARSQRSWWRRWQPRSAGSPMAERSWRRCQA